MVESSQRGDPNAVYALGHNRRERTAAAAGRRAGTEEHDGVGPGESGAIDTAVPDPATLDREDLQALPSKQQAHFAALLQAEKAIAGSAIAGIHLPDRAATLARPNKRSRRPSRPKSTSIPAAESGQAPRPGERSET